MSGMKQYLFEVGDRTGHCENVGYRWPSYWGQQLEPSGSQL